MQYCTLTNDATRFSSEHTIRTTGAIRVNTLCQERRAAAAAAGVVAAAQVVVETRAMAVITSRAHRHQLTGANTVAWDVYYIIIYTYNQHV